MNNGHDGLMCSFLIAEDVSGSRLVVASFSGVHAVALAWRSVLVLHHPEVRFFCLESGSDLPRHALAEDPVFSRQTVY